ncbi:tectonic-like complex member MKS1 [Bicyclus anynana]|uniref:Tectonic-like complex member MKS1 n=1 Tax=Bicyclus anynana TaxID=110368 RepID=A0ABM3LJ44_BICAN|nr:tectonic-like complex member MKS1 [Bicyclus anynana]
MSEFICNKFAGVHWPKLPLEDLSIKIKMKSKESILALPTFEDYRDKTCEENLHILDNVTTEEHNFRWQNKVFSKWEWHRYSDLYNCNSEIELKYHDMIKGLDNYGHKKVFTYIHEDYQLPLPVGCKKKVEHSMVRLSDCFNRLNLEDVGNSEVSSSMKRLFRSEDNMSLDEDRWISMHIVLDCSQYNEDSQILYKEEHVLVSLFHNVSQNYLIVTPNINNIEYNAYSVENQPEIEYGVEIDFREEIETELVELLNSLLKKWEKEQKKLLSFVTPSLGRKNVFVTFEIVSAVDFDMDNLYIEFHIKIPDDLQCTGDLHGRTHTSKCLTTDDHYQWTYGHCLELQLESATGTDPGSLKIFLEAISVDWWGRHRTEGYSYLPLTLEPEEHERRLSCVRPQELDAVKANNRRFFVGGCHLIKDLDVLANPQLHNTNFSYTSTGSITVRWRTITQSQVGAARSAAPAPSAPGRAAALLSGAEAVLRQYKKAKATLTAATRSVEQLDGSDG